jgi:carbamoyl-phosphate synthase large subunit
MRAFKNELVKYFPDGKVFTADLHPELSPACRESDGYFQVVKVSDPAYSDELLKVCIANNIKLVIPTLDTELIPLSENAMLFREKGIHLIISSPEIVRICRDKKKLFQYFDSIGFPRTQEIDAQHPEFPVFVKPIDGSSSIGTMILRDEVQYLKKLNEDSELVFLKYLSPSDYTEFTIDMYYNRSDSLICAVPRERIEVRSGEVSKSVTRKDQMYKTIFEVFSKCKGFVGCITLQVFRRKNSDEIVGIEINPRFGGGYPLSYRAGANYPAYLIREYLLGEEIEHFDEWISDMLMLRYDDEIIVYDFKS